MTELPRETRVVIVGGGIIGLAIADGLARGGESNVVVVEKEPMLGTGSSAASAGGLRQQFGEAANVLYAMEGVRRIRSLREETGFDPEFREHGYLLLAGTEDRLGTLERNVALQNSLGLPSEILSAAEVKRRFPVLHTEDLAGAAFCGTDGYCDPHAVVMAFAAGAREAGIRLALGTEVTGFLREDDAVKGVRTSAGDVRSEVTVIAAGPQGREIGALANLSLPLLACRRQIFATGPFPIPADLPLVIDLDDPFYFRPESGGVLFSGAEVEETRDFDLTLDESGLLALVERAVHRCPMLADAEVTGGWAGLRTLTPDGLAILGDAPGRPGLVLAVGMSGHGITHAPAVGLAIAERILFGECRSLPMEPFRADRFGPGEEFGRGVLGGAAPPG